MFRKLGELFTGDSSQRSVDASPDNTADALSYWSTTEVDGHRVDVFDSEPADGPAGVVLFLHGHGRVMLNDNPVFSELLKRHRLAAVCPDGQRSWWLDRICDEFSSVVTPQAWLMETLLPFVGDRFQIRPPQIALLGISMGGQGVLQLSYRFASRFPVVAAISPAVDFHQLYGHGLPMDQMFDNVEEARQATVVLNLHPLAWPRYQWFCCDPLDADWMDGCVRLGMKLSSSGILHERDLETSAGGHSWDYFNQMAPIAIQHIANGLQQVAPAET
ncbi:MAG: alpha/beta hydrolase-fold protein [Planctomycetaceae bacterium]